MITHKLIDQFEDTGIAQVPIENGRTIRNARSLLRGVGMTLGAKVRTRAAEVQKYQGVINVVGVIEHGPVDGRGCYLCRKAAERVGRIGWLWTFADPVKGCNGSVSRIVNDDPERGLEFAVGGYWFYDAERAAKYLTNRKVVA